MPEILAPVGNEEMLRAALAARADAVYLGGKTGNARAFAGNFSDEELNRAIVACHMQGVKVYLTLNTLVKTHEMHEIVDFAKQVWTMGIDAVILQDLGLAHNLREAIPELPLHASTQLNVHSLEGVQELERLGFSRVILSRETELREMERMREAQSIEREVFIHGSLCVSHSGQCLLSGLIGGRSGNRGRCAQPCRKDWSLLQKNGEWSEANTWLGLRDLNTAEHMNAWKELDIASLKIEGRMKKPAYVYAAVRAYRALRDGESVEEAWFDVSSRAFTKGFALGDYGESVVQKKDTPKGSVIGRIETRNDGTYLLVERSVSKGDALHILTKKEKLLPYTVSTPLEVGETMRLSDIPDALHNSAVRRVFASGVEDEWQEVPALRRPLELWLTARAEKPLLLRARSGLTEVVMEGSVVQRAKSSPLSEDAFAKQLRKVGGTGFSEPELHLDVHEGVFAPVGAINSLRRDTLHLLTEKIARPTERVASAGLPALPHRASRTDAPTLALELQSNEDADGVSLRGVSRVYTEDFRNLAQYRKQWGVPIYAVQPPLFSERYRRHWVEEVKEAQPDGLLVRDLTGVGLAMELALPFHADFSLYAMNPWSSFPLREAFGAGGITISPELASGELEGFDTTGDHEMLAFGPIASMWLTHCPFAAQKGCRAGNGCARCEHREAMLRDQEGALYAWDRRYGVGRLYHSRCLDRVPDYSRCSHKPDRYRIVLRADRNNPAVVERARTGLLNGKNVGNIAMPYWKTQGYTVGAWKAGVE